MGKITTLVIGVAVGIIFSVGAYVYISTQAAKQLSKSRLEFTKKEIEKKQSELGMTCVDAPVAIRKYIESIAGYVDKLDKNERIDASDSILTEGNRIREIFFTCHMVNKMASGDHLDISIPPMMEDEELQTSVTAISVSLAQAAAAWCETKCIADSRKKVTTFLKIAKERLDSAVVLK